MVVSAGLSQPSSTRLLADRLTAATAADLRAAGIDASVHIIELREQAQALANHLLTGFPAPGLKTQIDAVLAGDGLIAVSPIFNASYSGLFKLFFDVIERDRLAGLPVLVAATGGTPRHSLALDHAFRPLFAYLGAAVVPTAVYAATADWGEAARPGEPGLTKRIERAAAELARAIASREPAGRSDAAAKPLEFDALMASLSADAPPKRNG